MSKIVLCETQKTTSVYHIEKLNQSFSGYGELCYILEHYFIYFLMEGFDTSIKAYIKDEIGITLKSEDPVRQIKEIINYRNYFTIDEKLQLQQKIRTTYLYSVAKKQKLLADMYLKNHLYLGALQTYQNLQKISGQLRTGEQAEVLYHMGLCQSRMFCFEEAKVSFKKALEIRQLKEIQEAYFLVSYIQGDYHTFLQDGEKISFSEERCKIIYGNIKQREEEIKNKEEFVKLKKIDYHRKKTDDMTTRRLTKAVLERWKDEYKKEII
ncbi:MULTISPECIES: hypothetical protein [Anaerostipes]|uniref:hypothetical protein n=1 Tax=Anaerostipes TaxID=207244 RepID=UPI0009534390|nr:MULTISPECIES: hypothetical protein [unclassified Anaerostipes]MCI5622746.1 hypothetical protein [Anaerostipes sp.]MDY2726669.1 hypothetical protein [Anaerostipes faecalis]OLR60105.1 hypothetical protein BHF70_11095 [Anaerostipes sp. 494a]